METPQIRRLPRGRHNLSPEQVRDDQRLRLISGVAEAVRESGYTDMSVASIIKVAGVSRETFYKLYDSKLDCYLDAFDFAAEFLLNHLASLSPVDGIPLEQFSTVLEAYLDSLARAPGFARIFLVESYAAGPEATRRRDQIQQAFADSMATLLGFDDSDEASHFACRLFTAGVSALITTPLMVEDGEAIRALAGQLVSEVELRFPNLA